MVETSACSRMAHDFCESAKYRAERRGPVSENCSEPEKGQARLARGSRASREPVWRGAGFSPLTSRAKFGDERRGQVANAIVPGRRFSGEIGGMFGDASLRRLIARSLRS